MQFRETISKEELNALPCEKFGGRIIIIDNEKDIESAVDYLRNATAIGFDTETRPNFRATDHHLVSLLQLATEDTAFLFRLNLIGLPTSLISLLQDKNTTKISLSSQDDFHSLRQRYNKLTPAGFIELQSIIGNYGIQERSLSKIYAILFGKRISKAQRLSNWEAPILTSAQLSYAATDAYTTLRIYQKLLTMKPTMPISE